MREKIMSKASDLFMKLGFKSVTMDDIAGEMAISKKTIYKFFSNKEILIEEITGLIHSEIHEIINQIVAQDYNAIEENFEIVIDGMVEVVNKGTARIAKINGINVAGKTGTVENFILVEGEKKQLTDHSTFIAFAPAEDPEIVVSVFIENGYWGSRWAAPIASLIIEKYLTDNVERKWLENRMVNGSLQSEYEKPYKFKSFTINE